MTPLRLLLLLGLSTLAAPAALLAQSSSGTAAAWQRVQALDAGPQVKYKTQEEARAGSLTHLARQEKALRDFLTTYPQDTHAFEGKLRLARALQIRAGFENSEAARNEARKVLDELDASASGAQRAEVDFARLAFLMRTARVSDAVQREQLLTASKRFQHDHPDDRRLPALLAEISGLFDREPELKRTLLLDAHKVTKDPGLAQRIVDDLKRLDLVGQPLALKFTTRAGKAIDLASYRGKVVVLIFFADFSPPAAEAVGQLQRAAREWPKDAVQVLGVSLDAKPEELAALVQRENVTWPVGFDGKGWGSPTVRALGINRLPTVWLIDQAGVLRSLNGVEGLGDQIRALLKARP